MLQAVNLPLQISCPACQSVNSRSFTFFESSLAAKSFRFSSLPPKGSAKVILDFIFATLLKNFFKNLFIGPVSSKRAPKVIGGF
jgi:hypothetical protein